MQYDDERETNEIREMELIAKSYFQELFFAGRRGNYEHILSGITLCISDEDNSKLKARYTKEDIEKALTKLDPIKAPGEDEFSVVFYQKCWAIIGENVTTFCLAHLNGGMDINSINKTNIVLIPMNSNPMDITPFRPIGLCNIIYKLMAKAMANRI
ncbi:hypothetical protein PVK06_019626 [Gossypium arboreum]|uniref:Reverse transcriptase n=1 Tax=Gossypium arboreum TaxID=29729 RepID=A0ABR0PK78_GOSAR|nr:hypothetical protein PVK06_019626 [Gossypium arboreum]